MNPFAVHIFSACSDGILRGKRGIGFSNCPTTETSRAATITSCLTTANHGASRTCNGSLTLLKFLQTITPLRARLPQKFDQHVLTSFLGHYAPLCSAGRAFTASCEFIMPLISLRITPELCGGCQPSAKSSLLARISVNERSNSQKGVRQMQLFRMVF